MATVTELVASLGIDLKEGSIQKINNFEEKLNGVIGTFEKIGKVATGGLGIKDFFMNSLGGAQDIMNMSRAYKISTDALQEWKFAAESSGVSAENLMTDLYHLRKDFFMNEKAVLSLADHFKRIDEAQALREGQNFYGLSIDTILTLKRGSKELREEMNKAPKTPKEVLLQAEKLNRELIRQKAILKKTAETVALEVTPKFNDWMDKFNSWMAESPGRAEMLVQGVTGALALLTGSSMISGISNFASALTPLLKAIGGLKRLLIGGAVAAAIYGLYDSFQAFKRGEETLIPWETIIKDFEIAADKVAETLDGIKDKWLKFKEWLKSEEGDKARGSLGTAWDWTAETLMGSLDAIWRTSESIGTSFINAYQALGDKGAFWENFMGRELATIPYLWEGFAGTSIEDAMSKRKARDNRPFNFLKPVDFMGVDLPNQSISKEVDLTGKSIKSLADTIHETMTLKKDAFGPMGSANGAPNFAGSMITIFTSETMQEAVQYLEDYGAMGAIEDMSVYQPSDVE